MTKNTQDLALAADALREAARLLDEAQRAVDSTEDRPLVHMVVSPWDDVACKAALDGSWVSATTTKESEITCLKCWIAWYEYVNNDYSESLSRAREQHAELQAKYDTLSETFSGERRRHERTKQQWATQRDTISEMLDQERAKEVELNSLRSQVARLTRDLALEKDANRPKPVAKGKRIIVLDPHITDGSARTERTDGPLTHHAKNGEMKAACADFREGDRLTPFTRLVHYNCFRCRWLMSERR